MNELAKNRLAFLEETINHYNSGNRCAVARPFMDAQKCKYSPLTLGLEGTTDGCAIGRHLDPQVAKRIDEKYPDGGVTHPPIYAQLPASMQALGPGFLKQMQFLHDRPQNWNEEGLSKRGSQFIATVKDNFCSGEAMYNTDIALSTDFSMV